MIRLDFGLGQTYVSNIRLNEAQGDMPTPSDTKEKILEAAESLFAEDGFDGTSLRAITTEAGVNLAAVNYHFGTKEALLSAVLERRVGTINNERLRRLDAVEARAAGGPPELEGVVRALLIPPFLIVAEWGESGRKFMRLVGRLHSETSEKIRDCFLAQFDEIVRRFAAALGRALPALTPHELGYRMHFIIGAMAHTMAWSHNLGMGPQAALRPAEHTEVLDHLVAFVVAGVSAPTTPDRTSSR